MSGEIRAGDAVLVPGRVIDWISPRRSFVTEIDDVAGDFVIRLDRLLPLKALRDVLRKARHRASWDELAALEPLLSTLDEIAGDTDGGRGVSKQPALGAAFGDVPTPWFVGNGLASDNGQRLFAAAMLRGDEVVGVVADWTCSHHHRRIREAISCAEAYAAAGTAAEGGEG